MEATPDILETILNRHSVRRGFESRAVPRHLIERIVACGEAAPSSKNAQPWRFHVVTDHSRIEALADCVLASEGVGTYVPRDPRTGQPRPEYTSTVRESGELLRAAPAAVWVENLGAFSVSRKTLANASGKAREGSLVAYGFELVGIGAAIENMWIAANLLGLGASFMGDVVIAEQAIQTELDFTGDLVGVLVVGYSAARRGPSALAPAFSDARRVVWHD